MPDPAPLRLGIMATHPVQYHAPLHRALANHAAVDLTVFYAHRPTPAEQGAEFGVPFTWDVDLLDGYRSVFLLNRRRPSVDGAFRGYDTPEIRRLIHARRFDAFVVNGWHALAYWQAIRACWEAGTPVMVRGDSQLAGDPFARRAVKRTLYPWFMSRFAACLSVGIRSAEYFRYYGARTVSNVPHFVDNEHFRIATERARDGRAALRARWGIPENAFVVLFAGKLVEKKRPLDVIHAAVELRDRAVHVLLAGDGALRLRCEAEAERLRVPVHFAGFLNQREIPSAYAASDVLVLPSDGRETWGLVVNEAMASGLPVLVSSEVGCYPDLVLEGRTGYGFPLGDRTRLATALSRLADAPEHRAELARRAMARVSHFSVSAAVEALLESVRVARRIA